MQTAEHHREQFELAYATAWAKDRDGGETPEQLAAEVKSWRVGDTYEADFPRLRFGWEGYQWARAGQCLAQIEEPAQPVAEICSASHDDAEFGERAIKPLCDISGMEYGTPLYAGAAPAAVAPFGYVNTHTGQFFTDVEPCRQGNEGHWRTVYLQPAAVEPQGEYPPLPSNIAHVMRRIRRCEAESAAQIVLQHAMRAYYDLGRQQPAAVAGPAREDRAAWFALAMGAAASLEDAANCLRDKDAQKAAMGAATHVRESCNKLWWSVAALEAPAAPALAIGPKLARIMGYREHYRTWGRQLSDATELVESHPSHWRIVGEAMDELAEALAAAPQAPAAPSYPPAFGPNDWVMSVAGTVVKLSEWEPGAVKARTIYGEAAPAAPPVDADGERYRWLRRWKGQEHEPLFTVQHEIDGTLWGGDLDAAIDAAIAAQAKEGGAA